MIGGITPPIAPAGYIPPEIITGDTDRLLVGDYEFPSATKITCRQEKRIQFTPIPGKTGTIKELTGYDDWNITVEFTILAAVYGAGLLSAPSNPLVKTMIQKMKELRAIWESKETLSVTHAMLKAYGIKNVVCKSFQIPNSPIQYNQPITIVFVSDEEFDLDLASLDSKSSIVESTL